MNGLMIACGPLQAIYIMAAGTGSMIEGAKVLFVFGLGTLPAMLGFGYFASFISNSMTQKILKFSGVAVIVLGLVMMNNGLTLSGSGYDVKSIATKISLANGNGDGSFIPNTQATSVNSGGNAGAVNQNVAVQKNDYQEIRMDVTAAGWSPDKFILKKGVPVHWIINGKEITGCNKAIVVPKYNLNFDIKKGEQTIEFTPTESGIVPWSCWMGMIQGIFIVKDNVDASDSAAVQKELNSVPAKKSGTCGMNGGSGGCGCGMMR
jgi:hypothetical protein